MSKCCPATKTAKILLIIGGINWGLVGFSNFDLVQYLFVDLLNLAMLAKIVYVLIGLSAVLMLAKCCGRCGGFQSDAKK